MSGDQFVTFEQIAAAMPAPLVWSQDAILKIGRQTRSPLKFIRAGNRTSPPLWSRKAVLSWFRKTYAKAPELVAEFESRLTAKLAPKAVKKVTVKL